MATSLIALVGCAGTNRNDEYGATPTVDYVEGLDVYSAPHQDSFLNQLAMNYRSYAIYNARTSGYPEVGELFAQKAVTAFSGETPFPETVGNWSVNDGADADVLRAAYDDMIEEFKNDATENRPDVAAEAQAKFDCWLSAESTAQEETAHQCHDRFIAAMDVLRNCKSGGCKVAKRAAAKPATIEIDKKEFYPDTRSLKTVGGASYPRDGIVIVNNVNVPANLVQTVPVGSAPMVFNQNIYGGDKHVSNSGNTVAVNSSNGSKCDCKTGRPVVINIPDNEPAVETCPCNQDPTLGEEVVTRDEFINMMMAMRAEIKAINDRLDALKPNDEKAVIKVRQIPLEPTQHVMEEIFEVHFDFNKAVIKPEYDALIRELATATQTNKNIKVSVVGHTDTSGSNSYNYALGGRRAEAVQKMLIQYGIPASQIVAVSAGEEDLKVQTPNNTPNAENRRVRVVKEVHYTEQPKPAPIVVEEYSETDECSDCDDE
jgi:outer membrane protein OmpA-like peptidoglycan-associated protein